MTKETQPEGKPERPTFWTGKPFRYLVILLALAVSVAIFAFRDKFTELAAFGYAGIFLVSLLSSATIILPAPSLALVFAMGSALPWLPVGLAAGAGEALGELTGYAAGFGGQAIIEDQKVYGWLQKWMAKRGDVTILILSIVPNPFFDLAGVAAGTMGFPIGRFLLITWLGKSIKTTIVAWAGSQSVALIEQLIR